MTKITRILFFYLFLFNNSFSQTNNKLISKKIDCTENYCKPTPEKNIKIDGNLKYIKESESDTNSFKDAHIYSLETDKNKLIIPIIKNIGLTIQFYPGKGHLEIRKPGFKQIFDFGDTYSPEKDYCREYYIRIIDASSTHMVLEKYCIPFQAMKSRMESNIDYILYDMESAEMRIILTDGGNETMKYPLIKNDPKIKKIKNGYILNWNVDSDHISYEYNINLKFTRKIDKDKNPYLDCKSTDKVVDGNFEGFLCSVRTYDVIYNSNKILQ
ncbi:hypothetical protein RGU70_05740 [Herbaspirillum sp. RTI4]|uniref:hypothetical protein n=1 Tax=Herbaspirillum sp. RTI4 TaxID=3048640 RepID=UPI002AB353C3|nr:hypothetical protein [Herbaspirillum sp. RTI4]MDY7577820.1 hypothetical protein [Herbaspirillum sp. RTI4]